MTRTVRADGEINRLRILAVARSAFAEHGIAVPVRDIARRADVAPATIYRHFPGRADLVHAVLSDHVADCETEMRRALEDSDPGRALRTTIQRFAQRQINERGLNDALFGPAGAAGPFTAQRRAHARLFEQLATALEPLAAFARKCRSKTYGPASSPSPRSATCPRTRRRRSSHGWST